jgi:hypothetical protein
MISALTGISLNVLQILATSNFNPENKTGTNNQFIRAC